MGTQRAWDELLVEFRALGGTAENVRQGRGALGRGLFPVAPSLPVRLHVPESLLVAMSDMALVNGEMRVGPNAPTGAREKAFLDRYQSLCSWGAGGRDEVESIIESVKALPQDLRRELLTEHRCGLWFDEETAQRVDTLFLASRCITYQGRDVVMPFLELCNHGDVGEYEYKDGISLAGTFSGEVLAKYSDTDSYGFFMSWGFAVERPLAISLAVAGKIGPSRLAVDRKFGGGQKSIKAWIPDLNVDGDTASVAFMLLGNKNYPRLPKGIFYRLMRDAGYDGVEEAFDVIQHINRTHFLDLLEALEGFEQPMARMLRRMARNQLHALSHCYGVRSI